MIPARAVVFTPCRETVMGCHYKCTLRLYFHSQERGTRSRAINLTKCVCLCSLGVLSSCSVELLVLLRAARATRRVIMRDLPQFLFSAPRLDISAQTRARCNKVSLNTFSDKVEESCRPGVVSLMCDCVSI